MRGWLRLIPWLFCLLIPVPLAVAGQAADGNDTEFKGSPLYWQVDLILANVAGKLTRIYNLTEDQEEYTRKLLTRRVKRFLHQHEGQVRPLVAEYVAYQTGQSIPPPETAKVFAERAMPLLAAMHKEIVDGNMQWRRILNAEQQAIHDRDLKLIDKTFARYDQQFRRWKAGQLLASDFPSVISRGPHRIMKNEDAWEYYVRRFIEDYQLDAGQAESAWSVLRTMREEARSYREAHREALARLDTEYAKLTAGTRKTDTQALKKARERRIELDKQREVLEKPIRHDMFERLKKQLDAIPRDDQKQARAQRDKQVKATEAEARRAYRERLKRQRGIAQTRPASPMTHPAPLRPVAATAPARP